jgi:uncharacterized membrane protein YhaH (DUF805 family)
LNPISEFFGRYADFSGRTSRKHFWQTAFALAGGLLLVGAICTTSVGPAAKSSPLLGLVMLGILCPSLALAVRRLHDTGRSGWWQLLQLTGLGSFVLLFWQLQRGASGPNRFGVDPLLAVAGGPPSQGFDGLQPTGGSGAPAGYPGGPPKKSKTGLVIGLVVLGVVIVAGLASVANKGGSSGADKTGAPMPVALNQPASVGGVEVTVTGVSQTQRVGGELVNEEAAPGGVLVVVNYTVKNTSDKPVSAGDMPDLTLRDANGTVYKPDTGKTAAYATEANLTAKALSDLNPGLSITDAEVFEVSTNTFDPSKWVVMVGDTAFAMQQQAVPNKPAPPQTTATPSQTVEATQTQATASNTADAVNVTVASFNNVPDAKAFPAQPFSGPVVAPDFNGEDRDYAQFKTRIMEAVNGGPNFAGSFAVVEFGCGADCATGFVTNLNTGHVQDLPVGGDGYTDLRVGGYPSSRLLATQWQSDDSSDHPACTRQYYDFDGLQFKLIWKGTVAGTCPERKH